MLTRLIKELIDSENWLSLSADVKATPTSRCWSATPRMSRRGPASTSRLVP